MTPTLRRAGDLVAAPWRNGQGTTRDVATCLGPDGALQWQVSIAGLVRDASFSLGCLKAEEAHPARPLRAC